MKTFLLFLVLAVVIYFGYRRTVDYGLPWEDHVVLTGYEQSMRYSGGREQIYVHGIVQNRTRKSVEAIIECKVLPGGMTLTPKSTVTVALPPESEEPFDMTLRSNTEVSGAACKIHRFTTEGGAEIRAWNWLRDRWDRLKAIAS